jgi:DNA (cytosine-5)-methyltransferase 1
MRASHGSVAGLFAGIGGFELGFARAGLSARLLCEKQSDAISVLERRFAGTKVETDIVTLAERSTYRLPAADVVAAGFPCQDLSQCGRTAGIYGCNSRLIHCVFELLRRRVRSPHWVVIENVPFMLRLHGGRAIWQLTRSLERLGFAWAYRVVDARSFGLPQRRKRVLLVASRTDDPRHVLFADDATPQLPSDEPDDRPRGFYWTEGNTGLGWAVDCIPTLKAGSTIGIPCPPGIWLPAADVVVTPTIEDAESMQGFPRGWTATPSSGPHYSQRCRWRLVGNAVPVPIAEWLGRRLLSPGTVTVDATKLDSTDPWPNAAFGALGSRFRMNASAWPEKNGWRGLSSRFGTRLINRPRLSLRAVSGFYSRLKRSTLRTDPRFLPSLRRFLKALGA